MNDFNSFFMGGFECADHINRSGQRVNLLRETEHDIRVREDYRLLSEMGIKTVREGICWSAVETAPYVYDFSEVKNRLEAAEEYGIQQIWDICHFGYPDGIYPTHPVFCDRFCAVCVAFAQFYAANCDQRLFIIPINEISFLSWHSGDVRGTVPFAVHSGFDIKYHLCKAAIQGVKLLKELIPDCFIIWVEPLIEIHGTEDTDPYHLIHMNENQFQAMDIVAGRMCPELGGSEDYMDILGFNYYWSCQWEHGGITLDWPEISEKRTPLSSLLRKVYERYGKPVFLSETGHFGCGRAPWIEEITRQCMLAMQYGVPFEGICIYPVTDRPDWDDLTSYSQCGIWDLDENKNRIVHDEYYKTVITCLNQVYSYSEND